ncbi:hypothetical protein [Euzebya tangerina]|uniref:hypothetical protein n=1 Tax=Euzebya tangerina TaxID=591198 RepID=UPI0013C2B8B5|nr:hypothetical protein [Euzebya tangerina]
MAVMDVLRDRPWVGVALAAGMTVIALVMTVGGGSGLEGWAVGTWACQGTQAGEGSFANERHDGPPAAFEEVAEGLDDYREFEAAPPEDQTRYSSGGMLTASGRISVWENGAFMTQGMGVRREDVSTGRWSVVDGVPLVEFADDGVIPERIEQNYAVDGDFGNDSARILSWDSLSSSRLFNAQVNWADESVSFTLNSNRVIYDGTCTRISDTPTRLS